MGPWPGDHGNIERTREERSGTVASMGPWPGDHGNGRYCTPSPPAVVLQWGRGLVTTEIHTIADMRVDDAGLQWGRGLVTTEIARDRPTRCPSDRFNGAVAW